MYRNISFRTIFRTMRVCNPIRIYSSSHNYETDSSDSKYDNIKCTYDSKKSESNDGLKQIRTGVNQHTLCQLFIHDDVFRMEDEIVLLSPPTNMI
jgi:hypothetical protein